MITKEFIQNITGLELSEKLNCNQFSYLNEHEAKNSLSFIDCTNFIDELESNMAISAVFVTEALINKIKRTDLVFIKCSAPRYFFTICRNAFLKPKFIPSKISKKAVIHSTAVISELGVRIKKNAIIGAHVVIHPGTIISKDVRIDANTVIGSTAFDYEITSINPILNEQINDIKIKQNVHIHSSVVIESGVTVISGHVKIGSHSLISSDCIIGKSSFIKPFSFIEKKTIISKCSVVSSAFSHSTNTSDYTFENTKKRIK